MKRSPLKARTRMKPRSRKQAAFERAYVALRETILDRDQYQCQHCYRGLLRAPQKLEVHHVIKRSASKRARLDPDNLISLCRECHSMTDGDYARGRLVITSLGNGKFQIRKVFARNKFEFRRANELGTNR